MQPAPVPRPLRILARDLFLAGVFAVALYLLFAIFDVRHLAPFTSSEVDLLEAGAIVLVAYLVARALGHAATSVLQREGLSSRRHAVRIFLNLLIAIGAVLALFRLAGVSADSIFLGAGFTGIVLGLAAQTVLANVFAGLLLVFADPFRPGDRVSLVSASYGVLPPTYPHEAIYPSYGGTVEDIGLVYTILALDSGGQARVPNAVVISALLLAPRGPLLHRVRLSVPTSVGIAGVEGLLPAISEAFPPPFAGAPPARIELAEVGSTSYDLVVVLWSPVRDPGAVRDKVLRLLLPALGPPAGSGRPAR